MRSRVENVEPGFEVCFRKCLNLSTPCFCISESFRLVSHSAWGVFVTYSFFLYSFHNFLFTQIVLLRSQLIPTNPYECTTVLLPSLDLLYFDSLISLIYWFELFLEGFEQLRTLKPGQEVSKVEEGSSEGKEEVVVEVEGLSMGFFFICYGGRWSWRGERGGGRRGRRRSGSELRVGKRSR